MARLTPGRAAAWLGLVVIVAAAAWLATRSLGGASQPGGSGPPRSAARVGIEVGEMAPDFTADDGSPLLIGLDGEPISLMAYRGRPLWIVFWATWCTPCQEEASGIRDAYHAHRDARLAVLAIDVQEPAAAASRYAGAHGLDYDVGLDATAAVQDLYGGWGLPTHYFLDAAGAIQDRYLGQLTPELMEQRLAAILPR